LAVRADLIRGRVTCVQPLFFESSHLGTGECGKRQPTKGFRDTDRGDDELDASIEKLPVDFETLAQPCRHRLDEQVWPAQRWQEGVRKLNQDSQSTDWVCQSGTR
jgi:hypothetical protein